MLNFGASEPRVGGGPGAGPPGPPLDPHLVIYCFGQKSARFFRQVSVFLIETVASSLFKACNRVHHHGPKSGTDGHALV